MPDEPNRKIEELLKSYAQKRRADAGAPSPLHPATRRLLQTEVARLRPRTQPRSAQWLATLLRSWRGLAFAGSIAALMAIGVWTLVWSQRSGSESYQMARQTADNDMLKPPLPSAAQDKPLPAEKRTVLAVEDFSLGPRSPGRDDGWRANGVTNLALTRGLQLAQAPPSAHAPGNGEVADLLGPAPTRPVDGLADARESSLSLGLPLVTAAANQPPGSERAGGQDALFLYKEAAPLPGPRLREQPAVAAPTEALLSAQPAASAVRPKLAEEAKATLTRGISESEAGRLGAVEGNAKQAQVRQRYSQVAPALAPGPGPAAGAALSVLRSFEVEQTGERLRIYDTDGSVYEGRFLAEHEAAAKQETAAVPEATRLEQLQVESLSRRSLDRGSLPRTPNFAVAGTNRTLNQEVELRGVFVGGTGPAKPAFQSDPAQRSDTQPLPPQVRPQAGAPAGAAQAGAGLAGKDAAQSATDQTARIRAKVRIGTNQELEIDAVPVPAR